MCECVCALKRERERIESANNLHSLKHNKKRETRASERKTNLLRHQQQLQQTAIISFICDPIYFKYIISPLSTPFMHVLSFTFLKTHRLNKVFLPLSILQLSSSPSSFHFPRSLSLNCCVNAKNMQNCSNGLLLHLTLLTV